MRSSFCSRGIGLHLGVEDEDRIGGDCGQRFEKRHGEDLSGKGATMIALVSHPECIHYPVRPVVELWDTNSDLWTGYYLEGRA